MKKLIFILLSFYCILSYGQCLDFFEEKIDSDNVFKIKSSCFEEIEKLDMGFLWLDSLIQNKKLGFIGKNYKRLDIRFLEVIKDPNNFNQYIIQGKSRVSDNISDFIGIITVNESYCLETNDIIPVNSGVILGKYTLYEDFDNKFSGTFTGNFITLFQKDMDGNYKYLELPENMGNNQFCGFWYAKGDKKAVRANWGDNRIPDSGDLDIGTSEFGVNEKYRLNGWDSFIKAHGGGLDKNIIKEAQLKETTEWWKK